MVQTADIGVNSYWAQGLKPPPLLWSWGSPIWRAPHLSDVILSKLCFNCSHWFFAMLTNRQLDHSFAAVLDIFEKGLNLPAPLDIQWPKCFQLQGASPPDHGLCLLTPLGALPPDSRYIGSCSSLAMVAPSAAYNPRSSSPPLILTSLRPWLHTTAALTTHTPVLWYNFWFSQTNSKNNFNL